MKGSVICYACELVNNDKVKYKYKKYKCKSCSLVGRLAKTCISNSKKNKNRYVEVG